MDTSSDEQTKTSNVEEELTAVIELINAATIPMVLRAAIELDIFDILAKSGGQLSASEIASNIPTQNPQAPAMLERMLRFLATNSILTCTPTNGANRIYGLTPISKYFIRDQDGLSMAHTILFNQDKVVLDSWYHLKDAVIEGGVPFDKAHGMNAFEYPSKDNRFNQAFNKAMCSRTNVVVKKILETYNGFEGVTVLVDVGSGTGATLSAIISKYPHIKGINFDLPHVIRDAPPCPGVEHVEGDMFESVPKGDVIFMKRVLHDWGDDHCVNLLKSCWNALPECGKVIVVESILPEYPDTDFISKIVTRSDMVMMTLNPGGKERTFEQYEALAKQAGFGASKLICRAFVQWVMEFYKNV